MEGFLPPTSSARPIGGHGGMAGVCVIHVATLTDPFYDHDEDRRYEHHINDDDDDTEAKHGEGGCGVHRHPRK